MKKLFVGLILLCFVCFVPLVFADTDTIEGTATADTDTYEGTADTVTDTFEGQTVASGGGTDSVQFGTPLSQTCSSYSGTPSYTNRFDATSNVAEAFTGTAAEIHYITVYIGSGSGGTTTYVGLYDDNAGDPGVQLTSGSLVAAAGGWHKVAVTDYTTSAVTYWIVFGRGSGNTLQTGNELWTGNCVAGQDFSNNNLPSDDYASWSDSSETALQGMFACGY